MNVSKAEQRVLHALAQGGKINPIKNEKGAIIEVECFNREGWLMTQCNLALFKRLKAKDAIASSNGQPYRITRRGLELVRARADNR
ncbi:YjhX family toxin [Paradevosia shaoguanensis]|jgi:uncharacterized protein YjhX (UPF0386 family)|uniref:UPF0386 protein ML536_11030 n=1 Tax=Paradevosia shaoguanensis TaxID=1335043 RepID=A0AA41QP10_9HYPH|nr:YjhX family toxin [Paradevosia shaoguanensis]MCF1742876.1 YjhX family toxin [Paradevosia shaoguanensis]MCI0127359.1 YjhX family toxin [Paradevosia shaoguanensis]